MTNEQIDFLLSELIGFDTYTLVVNPSHDFDYLGLTECIGYDDTIRIKSNIIDIYPVESDDIKNVTDVFRSNDVDLDYYSHVAAVKEADAVSYMLLWGDINLEENFQ
jgi:hypothetical protein